MQVNIAAQCYDFIDKHIQNLDEDLRLLDNEVRVDKEKLGLAEDEPLEAGRSGRGGGGNRSRSSAAVAAAEGVPDKKRKGYRKRGYQGEEEGRPSMIVGLLFLCESFSIGLSDIYV